MTIIITDHAKRRMKERLHIKSHRRQQETSQKAWDIGDDVSKDKELLLNHVSGLPYCEQDKRYKLLRGFLFVFSLKGVLLTARPAKVTHLMNRDAKPYLSQAYFDYETPSMSNRL